MHLLNIHTGAGGCRIEAGIRYRGMSAVFYKGKTRHMDMARHGEEVADV